MYVYFLSLDCFTYRYQRLFRDAGGGAAGGAHAPQVLGYQLTLFGPRGADYAHHITTVPPIFLDDAASLLN